MENYLETLEEIELENLVRKAKFRLKNLWEQQWTDETIREIETFGYYVTVIKKDLPGYHRTTIQLEARLSTYALYGPGTYEAEPSYYLEVEECPTEPEEGVFYLRAEEDLDDLQSEDYLLEGKWEYGDWDSPKSGTGYAPIYLYYATPAIPSGDCWVISKGFAQRWTRQGDQYYYQAQPVLSLAEWNQHPPFVLSPHMNLPPT